VLLVHLRRGENVACAAPASGIAEENASLDERQNRSSQFKTYENYRYIIGAFRSTMLSMPCSKIP
jgi:hypothetical protein